MCANTLKKATPQHPCWHCLSNFYTLSIWWFRKRSLCWAPVVTPVILPTWDYKFKALSSNPRPPKKKNPKPCLMGNSYSHASAQVGMVSIRGKAANSPPPLFSSLKCLPLFLISQGIMYKDSLEHLIKSSTGRLSGWFNQSAAQFYPDSRREVSARSVGLVTLTLHKGPASQLLC
jgi:hypothetical protein